jgi:hypothetical protein
VQQRDEVIGRERRACAGVFDQEAQLDEVLFAPTQTHRRRERHGNEPRILAGEEQDDELSASLGDQRNAVAAVDTHQTEKTPGGVHRLRAQLPIAQLTDNLAATVEERQ